MDDKSLDTKDSEHRDQPTLSSGNVVQCTQDNLGHSIFTDTGDLTTEWQRDIIQGCELSLSCENNAYQVDCGMSEILKDSEPFALYNVRITNNVRNTHEISKHQNELEMSTTRESNADETTVPMINSNQPISPRNITPMDSEGQIRQTVTKSYTRPSARKNKHSQYPDDITEQQTVNQGHLIPLSQEDLSGCNQMDNSSLTQHNNLAEYVSFISESELEASKSQSNLTELYQRNRRRFLSVNPCHDNEVNLNPPERESNNVAYVPQNTDGYQDGIQSIIALAHEEQLQGFKKPQTEIKAGQPNPETSSPTATTEQRSHNTVISKSNAQTLTSTPEAILQMIYNETSTDTQNWLKEIEDTRNLFFPENTSLRTGEHDQTCGTMADGQNNCAKIYHNDAMPDKQLDNKYGTTNQILMRMNLSDKYEDNVAADEPNNVRENQQRTDTCTEVEKALTPNVNARNSREQDNIATSGNVASVSFTEPGEAAKSHEKSMECIPTPQYENVERYHQAGTTAISSFKPEINFEIQNQTSRAKVQQVPISVPLKRPPRKDTAHSANVHRRDYSQQLGHNTNIHFTTQNTVTERQRHNKTITKSSLHELSNNQKPVSRKAQPVSKTLSLVKRQSFSSVKGSFKAIMLGNKTIIQSSTNQNNTVSPKRNDQLHACPECEKSFTNLESLNEHIKMEHEGKRYQCSECSAEFKNKHGLSRHKEAEHKGKRYHCKECSAEFKYKHALSRHKEAKHKGKRYHCKECSAEFKYIQDLKRHQEAEHEGKRYQCSECSEEFKRKPYLLRHQKSQHEGKIYPCSECSAEFKYKHVLTRHQEAKH